MRYRNEVVISIEEWWDIEERLERGARAEAEVAKYAERDREYFAWSMDIGARMNDALALARSVEACAEQDR